MCRPIILLKSHLIGASQFFIIINSGAYNEVIKMQIFQSNFRANPLPPPVKKPQPLHHGINFRFCDENFGDLEKSLIETGSDKFKITYSLLVMWYYILYKNIHETLDKLIF